MKTEPHAEPRRDPPPSSTRLRRAMAVRFSLLADKADDAVIERRIREGVALQGATPWILMFAIFIASIGLNVNSTAVIIGAMLISPLMGPIMGVGLPGAKMLVHQAGENDRIDVTALKTSLLSDLYRDSQDALQKKDAELAALRYRLAAREALLNQTDAIAAELRALLPATTSVTLSQGYRVVDDAGTSPVVQLIVQSSNDIAGPDRDRIVAWFKARAGTDAVAVAFDRTRD